MVERALTAVVAAIFPRDELGPGAEDVEASAYVARSLAAAEPERRARVVETLEALDAVARDRFGRGCDVLAQEELATLLAAVERGEIGLEGRRALDDLVAWTRQGVFGDPSAGGNRGGEGWKLLGYPPYVERTAGAPSPPRLRPSRAQPADETDVAVVGLGAAGGIAAFVLASAGLDVVGFEAGPFRDSRDFRADELGNWRYRNDLGPKFNAERPRWRRSAADATVLAPASIGMLANGVGGSSVVYAGQSRRFAPDEFRSLTSTLERYGESALPADATLADWPVTYDELEPYYDRVEHLLGVSGLARKVRGAPERSCGNPFEGERSREFPLPPLRAFPDGELFAQATRALGYNPYTVPAAVLSQDYDGRPGCSYCGWCIGYGCRFGSKSSTLVTTIPKAVATGRFHLCSSCRVTRVVVEGDKAVGVDYVDASGGERRLRARAVVLAAYTFENVRLLLLSRSARFPDGVGNQRGQVGKHFMSRNFVEVLGLFPGRSFDRFAGSAAQAVCIDDFNGDNFDHRRLGFIRGGSIGTESQLQPISAATRIPPRVPAWGREYKAFLLRNWNAVTVVRAQPEPLPYAGNELDLDTAAEDGPLRLPRIRITYSIRENERRQAAFLRERIVEIMREMGASELWHGAPESGVLSAHDVGGARMGVDPAGSVVDGSCRVHDVDGLLVLGGATFATLPGANPTETIQAVAWRASEHLAAALGEKRPAERLVGGPA
jgi:gluconate 2-dehydrogenase alpha chain